MESPPFTPINAPATPLNPAEGAAATLPDLSKINTQLSPVSATSSATGASTPAGLAPNSTSAAFDEHAWETYRNQCKAEYSDVRLNALSRVKGTARDIDSLSREYAHMSEYAEPLKTFKLWWEGQKPKAKLYEDKVKLLEMPNEEQAKKDRLAKGLTV
jgi:hypothetical protein